MASPSEWGPTAWELLHGIAERVGNNTLHSMIQDEKNGIKYTLQHFGSLLPCLKCQSHYKEWLRKHSIDFTKGYGEFLQDHLRQWIFDLHENVNKDRMVESGLSIEDLPALYRSVHLREKANILKSFFSRGLQMGVFKSEEWKTAWRHLDMLLRTLGC
jgi:hypothetical protein